MAVVSQKVTIDIYINSGIITSTMSRSLVPMRKGAPVLRDARSRPKPAGGTPSISSVSAKRREEIRQKQDEFLDAYLDWKASRHTTERAKVLALAKQLHELDPTFRFTVLQ